MKNRVKLFLKVASSQKVHKRGEKTKDLIWKGDMDEKQGEIISKGGLIDQEICA